MAILEYKGKKKSEKILKTKGEKHNEILFDGNLLIHGDNRDALYSLKENSFIRDKIKLVYIDPPFSTNTVFRNGKDRTRSISSSNQDRIAYEDTLTGDKFLEFIRERLYLLYELMADSSSIYLHIDYKIGHYVKVIMDEVFGMENFHNDITRIKCNPKNFSRKGYGNIKDMILFYTKGIDYRWNPVYEPYSEEDIARLFNKIDLNGRHYTTVPVHAPGETKNGATGQIWKGMSPPKGRHWRVSPDELDELDRKGSIEWSKNGVPRRIIFPEDRKGKKIQDIWTFKDTQNPMYPTQKNDDLLKRIIQASSNEEDYVLDCFAGSGTTLINAHKLGRNWIGVDSSEESIKTIKRRFDELPQTLLSDNKYKFVSLYS